MALKPLAIAYGAPSQVRFPSDIRDALFGAVRANPDAGFVFAGAASERALTYADCLDRALRCVNGLMLTGLRAGDALIVDITDPEEAIPVLWAGLFAGLRIAPVRISRWNTRAHREASERIADLARRLRRPFFISADSTLADSSGCTRMTPAALCEHPPCARSAFDPEVDPRMLVSTSGTTGTAQLVELDASALMHRWWPEGPDRHDERRWLGWMPMDHVMGLGMAAPGARVKVLLDTDAFVRAPARWADLVERHRVTHAGMSSFALRRVADALQAGMTPDLSSLQRVGVGAEPVDRSACTRFLTVIARGGAPRDAVVLGYGLTECGPVAGGERSFDPEHTIDGALPIDRPTVGHAFRIVDAGGALLREGEVGAIEVRGPTMTRAYVDDPEGTARLMTADGWLRSGDLGWVAQGCLYVSGRAKEVLLVNARKVPCAQVDAIAGAVSGVALACAVALPATADSGERPAVVFVPEPGHGDIAAIAVEIRRVVADRFGFGLARCVSIAAEDLPRTATGKLQRHRLARWLTTFPVSAGDGHRGTDALPTAAPEPASSPDVPQEILDRVRAVMHGVLAGEMPGPDQDFFAAGGDSMGALMLSLDLERAFAVPVPPALVARNPTPRALATHLATAPARIAGISVVDSTRAGASHRLFAVPGIWGRDGFGAYLEPALSADIGLWSLHMAEGAAAPPDTLEELAWRCLARILSVQPDGPYHLIGHSFGAVLAWEIARQIQDAGGRVGMLMLIDMAAGLEARRGAVPPARPGVTGTLARHRSLGHAYLPGPLEAQVDLVLAQDSPSRDLNDPTAGWRYLAEGGVRVTALPGDHHTVVRGEGRQAIARLINARLAGLAVGAVHPHVALPADFWPRADVARRAALAGDVDGELVALEAVVKLGKEVPAWVYERQAAACLASGRAEAGVAALQLAIAITPQPLQLCARLIGPLIAQRQTRAATAILARVRNTTIDSPATASACAKVLQACGETRQAEQVLRAGMACMPESLELRRFVVQLLALEGRREDLIREIRSALAVRSENEEACRAMAEAALKLNATEAARACLERCLAISPTRSDVEAALARLR